MLYRNKIYTQLVVKEWKDNNFAPIRSNKILAMILDLGYATYGAALSPKSMRILSFATTCTILLPAGAEWGRPLESRLG